MSDDDLPVVRDIYAQGIATRNATFETEVPGLSALATKWLPSHRWVAERVETVERSLHELEEPVEQDGRVGCDVVLAQDLCPHRGLGQLREQLVG